MWTMTEVPRNDNTPIGTEADLVAKFQDIRLEYASGYALQGVYPPAYPRKLATHYTTTNTMLEGRGKLEQAIVIVNLAEKTFMS
jgi:hypothetical protein